MESNLTVRGVSAADKSAASGKNKSVAFSLSNLPAEVERELRFLDTDGSGDIDVSEIRHAATVFTESKQTVSRYRKLAIFGLVAFVLLSVTQFAVMYGAVLVARQSLVSDSGVLTMREPNSTSVVQTASSEFYVGEDGLMRARSADVVTKAGAATKVNSSNSVLGVGVATVSAAISSDLGDDAFFQLKFIAVESFTGATMHLSVLGFVRHASTTPGFRGAMEIVTHVGRIVLTGTAISYVDDMQAALFAAHGFIQSTAAGATTTTSRRQLQIRTLYGLFNAIVDARDLVPAAFESNTVALPPTLPDNFIMFARRRSPCIPHSVLDNKTAVVTPKYTGNGSLPTGPGVDVCTALSIPESELVMTPDGTRFVSMTVTIYRFGSSYLRTEYTHPLLPNQSFVEVLDTSDPENPAQFEFQVEGAARGISIVDAEVASPILNKTLSGPVPM